MKRITKNLSKAITFNTTSNYDLEKVDFGPYLAFRDFLEEAYPLVFEKANVELVHEHALVFKWASKQAFKAPILALAHYDVVPTGDPSKWTHPPFSGTVDENYIWGRGTLDDKGILISLLEALQRLLEENRSLSYDLYLAFGFDEEVGGSNGACYLSKYFENKGIEFEMILDEGGVIASEMLPGIAKPFAIIGLSEKGSTSIELTFSGAGGHSSMPPEINSLNALSKSVEDLRKHPMPSRLILPTKLMLEQLSKHMNGLQARLTKNPRLSFPILSKVLASNPTMNSFIRTTITPTMAQSGTAANVLPPTSKLTLNLRILQGDTIESTLNHIRKYIPKDTKIKVLQQENPTPISPVDSVSYKLLKQTVEDLFGIEVLPYLMAGGTDARHYRNLSKNIYRFSPMRLNKELFSTIHSYDERILIENLEEIATFYHKLFLAFDK